MALNLPADHEAGSTWPNKARQAWTDAGNGKLLGALAVDSFGTPGVDDDDVMLEAALTQLRADTYRRSLFFSNRQYTFSDTHLLNFDGGTFLGPLGGNGDEFRETNRIICPAAGLFQFVNGGYRHFVFRGLSFQASSSGVWMPAWATDSSAGHWDDVRIEDCGFQGFSNIINGTVLRFKIDNVYVNGATDTQFNLGGSDSKLFMYGMNFLSGTLPSNKPWIALGMSSTDVNIGYITPQTGYALQVFYTQGGLVVHGGKSDATGRSGSLATQQAGIQQTSGVPSTSTVIYDKVWVFNAGQGGTSKGLIEVKGGRAVFNMPNFPGSMTGTTPAVTNIAGIYTTVPIRVMSPIAENNGYKVLRQASAGLIYCDDSSWTIQTAA